MVKETHEQAVKRGKKSRKEGKDFEIRVRSNLVEKGWIVNRFDNDVKEGKLVQAKTSWRRTPHGMFPMNLSPGMPDFVCFKLVTRVMTSCFLPGEEGEQLIDKHYDVIAVECKITGTLDKLEKQKCQWYLDNHIFSRILIAYKTKEKNRIKVNYKEFC